MRLSSYLTGWNLDDGRRFATRLETELAPRGWHVGIGGSVLHKGESAKDLDVFVVPRSTVRSTIADLELGLIASGLHRVRTAAQVVKHWRRMGSDDGKRVEIWALGPKAQIEQGFDPGPKRKGRRVDIIALVPWSMP